MENPQIPNLSAFELHAPQGRHFVSNGWYPPDSGETIEAVCPADGTSLGRLGAGNATDVDHAVLAARAALDGEWGKLSATQRGRLLTRLSQLIVDNAERLAWVEAMDTGKPISTARADVQLLARYFEYYGGAADKIAGATIPYQSGFAVSVVREPHGVTAHIIPWNYPVQMFGRSVAPALAMGNAAVVKPAEDACLSILEIAALARDAGFPGGALNIVTGYGSDAGAALAGHGGINYISFTGSQRTGVLIQGAAARHNVPVCLELGGKSPQIVFADADLAKAAATVVKAIVQNAGQTCSAGSRVLVERTVYPEFMERVAAGFRNLRIGAPAEDADLGPLINARQRGLVEGYVARAEADAIPVIARTPLPVHLAAAGHYVSPVVFGPVPVGHELSLSEVFGPVLAAQPFDNEDEAVALANSTDYGLVAGVWTRDGDRQVRMSRRIIAGQVYINCYGAGGGVELPFGGTRRSGHGREKGWQALEEMSTTKTIVHQFN